MNPVEFLSRYGTQIWQYSLEHLYLVLVSITLALAIGLPLGIVITRQPAFAKFVLGFANGIQTVPSLALFAVLITVPFLGISTRTAIVALVLYALLPIIRSTHTGILGVDAAIREAGRGMGMTDWQLLVQVELPLAASVILSGVRVAMVLTVGLAAIAALIGAGGLGALILRGVNLVDHGLILAGTLPASVMALIIDWGLGRLERRLRPKSQSR